MSDKEQSLAENEEKTASESQVFDPTAPVTEAQAMKVPEDLSKRYNTWQKCLLGLQNTVGMSGVILVPILAGLDVSVTLFCAGLGTIIYQIIDKRLIPAFLGGSFALLAALQVVIGDKGVEYAQGGIIAAMVIYFLFAVVLKILGPKGVAKVFPPLVTGPIIMVIGLSLAGVGISEAQDNWPIAIATFAIAVLVNVFGKGLSKVLTIVLALIGGYIISLPFGLVDFTPVVEAPWFGLPHFTAPKFDIAAIALIAPAAIVPCIEHIGDVIAIGQTVGKDFTKNPGLPRSLFACGVVTGLSGLLGGPSLTIHSENTGVIALTRLYSPFIVRMGALYMACFAFIPKFAALCGTIPQAVLGGVGILLYGMITCVGIRNLVEGRVDFTQPKNLITGAAILILGVGGATFVFPGNITLGGMAIAAIAGIILNLVLPSKKDSKKAISA
jgi:uracil permease